MKKALIVATVLKKHIVQFHIPTIKMLKGMGWQVDVAAADDYDGEYDVSFCDNYYDIPFGRSPLSKTNITAYKQLKQLIDEGDYDVVHCHTPMGGFLTRLAACEARKKGTKVFYTAHGFHFYKGAPLLNWVLYYPAEKYCSGMTDVLITITKEDYELAKRKMKAAAIEYIPGIGIDVDKFRNAEALCQKETGKYRLLSVGEMVKNKNHISVIKALKLLNRDDIEYYIAGEGELKEELQKQAEELLPGQVHFLGYRNDLPQIYKSTDLFIHPSFREGMPVALMEAMAAGVPCIASDVRGSRDLLDEKYLFDPNDIDDIKSRIKDFLTGKLSDNGKDNQEIARKYSEDIVLRKIKALYEKFNNMQLLIMQNYDRRLD